jgi:hypothetical protein
MRKIAVLLATLFVGAFSLSAQSPFNYSGRWNISLSGGMLATVSENTFAYFEQGRGKEIFDLSGAIAVGYDFTGSLIGDKAVSVIFDNQKLKRAVPDMRTNVRFDQGVRIALDYVLSHPERQIPDPEFDEWCDKVIEAIEGAKF